MELSLYLLARVTYNPIFLCAFSKDSSFNRFQLTYFFIVTSTESAHRSITIRRSRKHFSHVQISIFFFIATIQSSRIDPLTILVRHNEIFQRLMTTTYKHNRRAIVRTKTQLLERNETHCRIYCTSAYDVVHYILFLRQDHSGFIRRCVFFDRFLRCSFSLYRYGECIMPPHGKPLLSIRPFSCISITMLIRIFPNSGYVRVYTGTICDGVLGWRHLISASKVRLVRRRKRRKYF